MYMYGNSALSHPYLWYIFMVFLRTGVRNCGFERGRGDGEVASSQRPVGTQMGRGLYHENTKAGKHKRERRTDADGEGGRRRPSVGRVRGRETRAQRGSWFMVRGWWWEERSAMSGQLSAASRQQSAGGDNSLLVQDLQSWTPLRGFPIRRPGCRQRRFPRILLRIPQRRPHPFRVLRAPPRHSRFNTSPNHQPTTTDDSITSPYKYRFSC